MTTTTQQLTLDSIRNLVADDFLAVDQLIATQLKSDVKLTKTICEHLIKSGGKRLRPLLVLLIAKALKYDGHKHLTLATIIEFIHTATLLHDDVVDGSEMRRGNQSANQLWGNAASVLVGDFLYTRSFQLLTKIEDHTVFTNLASITNDIAEGEILQLSYRNNAETTEDDYMHIIRCKTAKLFEAATFTTSLLCENSYDKQRQAMGNYGIHLGTAFQLVDDALDYSGNSEQLGKNIGDDLAEGKATLPLIYALKHAKPATQEIIKDAITHGGIEHMPTILEAIKQTQALEYTFERAKQESRLAIQQLCYLEDSKYRDSLEFLAEFSVQRNF